MTQNGGETADPPPETCSPYASAPRLRWFAGSATATTDAFVSVQPAAPVSTSPPGTTV